MPANHTPNYGFNQQEKTDNILLEDFNTDNGFENYCSTIGVEIPCTILRELQQSGK